MYCLKSKRQGSRGGNLLERDLGRTISSSGGRVTRSLDVTRGHFCQRRDMPSLARSPLLNCCLSSSHMHRESMRAMRRLSFLILK